MAISHRPSLRQAAHGSNQAHHITTFQPALSARTPNPASAHSSTPNASNSPSSSSSSLAPSLTHKWGRLDRVSGGYTRTMIGQRPNRTLHCAEETPDV